MSEVKIVLPKKEAFEVFGFLARYVYDKKLQIVDEKEAEALRLLCQALDDELVERFRDDYKKVVAKSRAQK